MTVTEFIRLKGFWFVTLVYFLVLTCHIIKTNVFKFNPAAANNTAVATGSAAKRSHLGHGTPANATANNTTELNPLAAVTVHPVTNDADVPSGGDIATTVGSSDSVKYGYLTILSLPSPPQPAAVETQLLSLNLLGGKISASSTTVDGEITRVVEHAANTAGGVETIMDTTCHRPWYWRESYPS